MNFLLIFYVISVTLTYDHFTNLTDYTFDSEVSDDSVKWVILFYTPSCKRCVNFTETLKRVMQNYPEDPVAFCLVNVEESKWISSRFNIRRLPELIIVEEGLYYKFRSRLSERKINDFINKKKLPEYGYSIPKTTSFAAIYRKYFSLLVSKIHFIITEKIIKKIHLGLSGAPVD